MNRKRFNVLVLAFVLPVFLGCAELNEFAKETSDVVAPRDIVTGQRCVGYGQDVPKMCLIVVRD